MAFMIFDGIAWPDAFLHINPCLDFQDFYRYDHNIHERHKHPGLNPWKPSS